MYYLQSRYYDPEVCRFINADAFASTGQGFLGCDMFAYCNNNPANCYDIEGKQAVRNKMLMTCDSFHSAQGTGALNYLLLQKYSAHDRYYLSPAYCSSANIETSLSNPLDNSFTCTAGISLAHGELLSEDSPLSMTTDILSAEASAGITRNGIEASAGVYIANESIGIRIADGIELRLGVSVGFGKKFSVSKNGIQLGDSALVGWKVAVVWGEQGDYKYFAELD